MVLLTGGSGFIGRHALMPLLDRGFEVHIATRSGEADASARQPVCGTLIHRCDLFQPAECRGLLERIRPTHLLHFAWYAEHGKYWTSPLNLDWVRASLHLLQTFAELGGRRAVCAGTCAEYDWSLGASSDGASSGGVCSEHTTPRNPRTLYGTCKDSLQEIVTRFSTQTGLSTAWGRMFFLYGPDEHPQRFVPSIVQPLREDHAARCNFGAHQRDFLHVFDAASAFVALLDSDVTGPVNIASGVPATLGDVAEQIADRLGKRRLLHVDALPPNPDNPQVLLADTRRLNVEVGWQPRFSLESGLNELLKPYAPSSTSTFLKTREKTGCGPLIPT